jgi:putative ABC transport system ATP-binding protein
MGFLLENVVYRNILDIPSLEMPGGKVTCIIGDSGSGKTTLMRLLNNLVSADRGIVWHMGENVDQADPVALRRKVVMLAQNPFILPGTVAENLLIGLAFAGKDPASEETLAEILQTVSLGKSLSDDAMELSGGEKQRLALARVLLLKPEALLLDEPSSALDERTEGEVIKEVVTLAKKDSRTLVMIVHSLDLARRFADLVVIVKGGKVEVAEGVAGA